MLKVFIKHPGRLGYAASIKDELKEMQEIVGGYIETVMFTVDKLVIVCNEEGRLLSLEPNSLDIRGTFFIAGVSGDEFRSLTRNEIKVCELLFNGGVV